MRYFITPIYRWGNWGAERVSHFLRILARGEAGLWIQAVSLQGPRVLLFYYDASSSSILPHKNGPTRSGPNGTPPPGKCAAETHLEKLPDWWTARCIQKARSELFEPPLDPRLIDPGQPHPLDFPSPLPLSSSLSLSSENSKPSKLEGIWDNFKSPLNGKWAGTWSWHLSFLT